MGNKSQLKKMTRQEQILNWLMIAFSNGSKAISELFYYDRENNEFFSILVIDYFMVDQNFNILEEVTVSYSQNSIKMLTNRMKRIANNDRSIISIPLADKDKPLQTQIDA